MSRPFVGELSRTINTEARRLYPALAKQLGTSSLLTTIAPRIALRIETPYPYLLSEDDALYPSDEKSFGRVIRRTRDQGLREIHDSISAQQLEHQWLFLSDESIWIDSTISADQVSVDSDQYIQTFISHLFPEIEAVHTHPDITVESLAETSPWDYSSNYLLEAARPSSEDLMRSSMMAARRATGAKTKDTIVSHYGVTSYSVIDAGEHTGLYQVKKHDRLIRDTTGDPSADIRAVLGIMSANTVLHATLSPAFEFEFEPLNA